MTWVVSWHMEVKKTKFASKYFEGTLDSMLRGIAI